MQTNVEKNLTETSLIFRMIFLLYKYVTIIPFLVVGIVLLSNGLHPIPWHIVTIVIGIILFNLIYVSMYIEYTEDKDSFGVRFLSRFMKIDVVALYLFILVYIGLCNSVFTMTN